MGPWSIRRTPDLIASHGCGWKKEGEGKGQAMKQTRVDTLGRGLAIHHRSNQRAVNSESNRCICPPALSLSHGLSGSKKQRFSGRTPKNFYIPAYLIPKMRSTKCKHSRTSTVVYIDLKVDY